MFRLKGKEHLYQWDSNVFVEVEDPRINQVQFSTKFSSSAYCVDVADGEAPIPNEMLQSYYDICAYACIVDDAGQSVEFSETFSVYARPKPDNYIYTPTEVITITKVEDELLKQIDSKVGIQPQDFTEEEKRIARENIGAISASDDSKMFYINVTDSSCDKTFTEVVRAYNAGSSIAAINSSGQIFPLTFVSKAGSVIRAFWFNKYEYPTAYEIYLSDTGSYSYKVISYIADWNKDETELGYIANRTHYIHRVKTKMNKDKTLASQTNTKLTDAQEDALAELGANTKSSSSLSFYLAPTSTLPENPPTVENTVVKVYYKSSSSVFSDAEAEFDVVELKSNDTLIGYALNFNNDNASYKSYLRTVVIVMVPYKGVKAGVYLPEYEASIFTGRGYSLEYESVHKLDSKFMPSPIEDILKGGYTGQALVKNSNLPGDISWGGDGLDFDSEMVIPMFPNDGNMMYIRVAPSKKPKFLGESVTQISSGAENIVSDVYSDGYALGYAVLNATTLGDLVRMNTSFFRNAENAVTDFDKLISGGYISNPIYLYHGEINYISTSQDMVEPIGRNSTVHYSKGTKSSRLDVTTADRAISLLYYYNESDIEDYYKNNFYVSGKWVVYVAYDMRGEKYSLHPQSYAGRILSIDTNGDADYHTPEELNIVQQQSDWNETDETSKAFIKNKPTISSSLSNLIDGTKEASVRSIAAYPDEDTGNPDSDYKLDVGAYALGRNTKASMMDAFAIGRDNEVTGDASYVGGVGSKCQSNYSHAEGLYTEAKGYNQYVYGKYNISSQQDGLSFIMGNGTNKQRSNSYTLSKTGEAWFAGDVYTGSTSGINKDSGSKKLATEEFVRGLIEELKTELAKTNSLESNPIAVQSTPTVSGTEYIPPMKLIKGRKYFQNGITYKCTTSTGIEVSNDLASLVGIYVEVINS